MPFPLAALAIGIRRLLTIILVAARRGVSTALLPLLFLAFVFLVLFVALLADCFAFFTIAVLLLDRIPCFQIQFLSMILGLFLPNFLPNDVVHRVFMSHTKGLVPIHDQFVRRSRVVDRSHHRIHTLCFLPRSVQISHSVLCWRIRFSQ